MNFAPPSGSLSSEQAQVFYSSYSIRLTIQKFLESCYDHSSPMQQEIKTLQQILPLLIAALIHIRKGKKSRLSELYVVLVQALSVELQQVPSGDGMSLPGRAEEGVDLDNVAHDT
mmetsp:Transcript_7859/g.11542  ORF Transcript_7859/g.11542 Transcript_7859/m.11542 type:complete len:115 (-) Transcript_7859:312-656(-)